MNFLNYGQRKLFEYLVQSPTFRRIVHKTESAILKSLRFLTNPEKSTAEFSREQLELTEKLSEEIKKKYNNQQNMDNILNKQINFEKIIPRPILNKYRELRYNYNVWKNRNK